MLASFHMTPNSLCVKLSHRLILTGWWAHPNCKPCLELCRFMQSFLKIEVPRWKVYFLIRISKRPLCIIHRNGWRITRGTQPKEECCTWSLVATTNRILALKLTASLRLMIGSLSSFVSNPCLTFLISTCISFTPNQVYPLVHIYHRAILWWFHKHLPFALVELVYHWFWATTLHGVGPLSSHVVMISPVSSCIHPVRLSKRM
jgi:hypothetical protein